MAQAPTTAEAETHVAYEIEAMCRAAARYAEEWGAKVNMATPSDWEDAVFFLEASLGHARSLIMAFGYPGRSERRLARAPRVAKGYEKPFRGGFSHPSADANKAYGQLSELIGHIGSARWDVPLVVDVHQPIEVAYSILDALDAGGVSGANALVSAVVEGGRQLLTDVA